MRRGAVAACAALAVAAALTLGAVPPAAATSLSADYCNGAARLSAADHDKLLRFAALVRETLAQSSARVALVARSGLDLARFSIRYSHAGLSLREHPQGPWAVRQLYVDCSDGEPRLFDQGLAAFVLGTHDPRRGHVVALLLHDEPARALETTALDAARALSLLGGRYSANAHAFSTLYQNCNQWLAELMAAAWGAPPAAAGQARAAAQGWLRASGYEPSTVDVGWPLIWAGAFIPWVQRADHPAEDLAAHRYRISLPASLEAFALRQVARTERLEFCHAGERAVLRRGPVPLAADCRAEEGDTVASLAP